MPTPIAQIDESLRTKIRDLTQHRRRIAELAEGGGERLFLPGEIVDLLDRLRALGVSERTVQIERDGWILAVALSPGSVPDWAQEKAAALADPGFQRLYLACDQAFDWDPADPRLAELADEMARWDAQRRPDRAPPDQAAGHQAVVTLLTSQFTASAAWRAAGRARPGPAAASTARARVIGGGPLF